jgi:thymidylate synthase
MRLQYLPVELQQFKEILVAKDEHIDTLGELIEHLKECIQSAPCLAAHPGEVTYECRTEAPCRVCQWRREVSKQLVDEWRLPDGIW